MRKIIILALALMLALVSTVFVAAEGTTVSLKRGYFDGNGGRGALRVVVAVAGNKVVGAAIDEYAYADKAEGIAGVPNSDSAFGAGAAEGKVLVSKRLEPSYSENMKAAGGATKTFNENFDAIQAYVVGKTVAELETLAASSEEGKPIDAISGATLVGSVYYLSKIVEVAKNGTLVSEGTAENVDNLVVKFALGAPHGARSFGEAVVVLENDKVVVVNFDEYMYSAGTPLAGAETSFAKGYAKAEAPLASKKVNAESYSKNMAEKAGSTQNIALSFAAIEEFVKGKTSAEILEFAASQTAGKAVDAISGSTLVDTVGYLTLIGEAAK